MSSTHSDLELILATQVAYLNMSEGENVQDKVNDIISKYDGNDKLTPLEEKQLDVAQTIIQIQKQAVDNGAQAVDLSKWTVVDICNDENGTGYYGCLIDTGDGSAVIGNRGSESYDYDQRSKDWVVADVGLLNSPLTTQQMAAEIYANELWEKYGDEYDYFDITGHSLGGNLAEHMAIVMAEKMGDKLNRAVSFDGPGFSDEYIEAHYEQISNAADKMEHYQWSWVSALLLDLPGVENKVVKSVSDPNYDGVKAEFYRHACYNVEFGSDGNVVEDDLGLILNSLHILTTEIDLEDNYYFSITLTVVLYLLIKGIKGYSLIKSEIEEFNNSLTDSLNDFYYDYIAADVKNRYVIVSGSLSNSEENILTLKSNIDSINEQIDTIRRELDYDSISGSYYKSKLFYYCSGLNSDLKKLEKLVSVAQESITSYSNADSKVEAMFA